MRKLLLVGLMMSWGAAAAAQDTGTSADSCTGALPVISETDVATVERNTDSGSAVIQLDVDAAVPGGGGLSYNFASPDGSLVSDGARATWTVSGAGPFTATVEVTSAGGCKSYAQFTYNMEQTGSDPGQAAQ